MIKTMFRNWKTCIICSVLIYLVFSNAFADNKYEPLLLVRGIRPMGLGNAFEAIADDENAFHYNPAGLAQRERALFDIPIFRPRISSDLTDESLKEIQDLYEAIDTLVDCDDPLGDPSPGCREAREILADRVEKALDESLGARFDLPSIGLAVPFNIAEKYRLTVGGSLYTQSSISLRVEPRGLIWSDPIKDMLDNAIVYNISAQRAWEIVSALEVPVNRSPILSKAYVGCAFRRIKRWTFTDEGNPFTVEDILSPDGPDGIKGTDDDFVERYFDVDHDPETLGDLIDLVSSNSKEYRGYSIDLGTILAPVDGLRFAFVIRNLISSISLEEEDSRFPRNVVFSAAVKPLVLLEKPFQALENLDQKIAPLLDMTFAASLDRRNGDDRTSDFSIGKYTDRIHLGAEATLFPSNIVSFSGRIGNNQGFLTLGASLKLGRLYLDFVKYGDLETDWYVGYINFRS